jgi:cytochrome b involved in lipid metabolism
MSFLCDCFSTTAERRVTAKFIPAADDSTVYTMDEIRTHTTNDSLWIIISGRVYDFTTFRNHPGGFSRLLAVGGRDATSIFMAIHDESVHHMLKDFLIGRVDTATIN